MSLTNAKDRKLCRVPVHTAGVTPFAEELEARRLFASFSFSGGVLTATGTVDAERFTVYRIVSGGGDETRVRVVNLRTSGSEDSGPYTTTNVTRVDVYAAYGADDIVVENAQDISDILTPIGTTPLGTTAVNKPTKLFGDGLVDRVYGGDQGDVIEGGYGADTLSGRGGNDTIYGGAGYADDVDSNDGGDTIDGGPGSDTCRGGFGADLLTGGDGSDSLFGESGDDTFFNNQDSVSDTLNGGTGSDTAGNYDGGGVDTLVSVEM